MSKRGRPKIANPKIKQYRLRLTEDEFNILKNKAKENNSTISEFIRTCVNNEITKGE